MYCRCQKCGKKLADPESMKRGYGPECWSEVLGYSIQELRAKEEKQVPGQMSIYMYPEFNPQKGDEENGG